MNQLLKINEFLGTQEPILTRPLLTYGLKNCFIEHQLQSVKIVLRYFMSNSRQFVKFNRFEINLDFESIESENHAVLCLI